MITTASGDLSNINTQLERIKDLATQYSNSSLTDEQKNAIKAEAKQRVEEINRIAEESKLNKLQLLDGSQAGGVRLQIGPNADPATNSLTVTGVFEKADVESLNLVGGSSKFADIDAAFANASTAAQFIDIVQDSADMVTERISTAGIYNARLESITDSLITKNENLQSAVSTVMDADVAAETANYKKSAAAANGFFFVNTSKSGSRRACIKTYQRACITLIQKLYKLPAIAVKKLCFSYKSLFFHANFCIFYTLVVEISNLM